MTPTQGQPAGGFTIPLAGASSGRLVLTSGAAGISILAAPALPALAQGRSLHDLGWVGFEAGMVMLGCRPPVTGPRRAGGEIRLNAAIPWEIELRGGVVGCRAWLKGLRLRSLDVLGSAREVSLMLGQPEGTAYVYFAGEARGITLRRPAEVGVAVCAAFSAAVYAAVYARAGIERLVFDRQHFLNVGREDRLESKGFHRSRSRYEISFAGEASRIRVEKE